MIGSPEPLDLLVVGWYPAADDGIAGRFVADQVAALHASGHVRPSIVTFENASLRGRIAARAEQAAAIARLTGEAVGAGTPFNPAGAGGPPGIPVARLAIAAGTTAMAGADHRAIHRTGAILPLLDRTDQPPWGLVHGHVGYPEGAAATAAAARLGVPLVITEHASFVASFLAEPLVRERYLGTLLAASRVIAVSETLAGELRAQIPAIDGRLVVIPNVVAIDDFAPVRPPERQPAELLYVGHRKEAKGIGTLLRAFALVHADRPEATLRLIGRSANDQEEATWLRLAGELRISEAVRFEPPADRAGVVSAMHRASCFVHPSPRETFGIVAVEALAAGLPVVAADSGGVTEILGADPATLGALVPALDAAALAAAIVRTLDRRASFDPDRLYAAVVERYGAATVAGRIVDLYDEVLVEAARGDRPRRARHSAVQAASPGASPPASRIVLASFLRTELDRALQRFPAWALDGVEIVTSGSTIAGRPNAMLAPPGSDERLADMLEWGAPSTTTRAGRLVRRIRRESRAVLGRAGRGELAGDPLVTELTHTLSRAIERGADGTPPLVVCLSGIDYLAAAPLIAAGRARPSPGGLRWLADRQADRRPATDPGSDA